MSVKKTQFQKNTFYFFTITCYKWLYLFELTNFYDQIYNWFDILNTKRINITAYVIMPNHLHCIIFYPEIELNINNIIGTGKRFMAYELVKRLEKNNKKSILKILEKGVSEPEMKRGKLHQVFEPSFDLKVIDSEKFMIQKLNYIHYNPVSKKWNLVRDYRDYVYSSAGYYEKGISGRYEVIHYLET